MRYFKMLGAICLLAVSTAFNGQTRTLLYKAHTIFFWYTAPNAVIFIHSATLATILTSAGGPYFTTPGGSHVTAVAFGFDTPSKAHIIYTLYK